MISEVFSNLNDSMNLFYDSAERFKAKNIIRSKDRKEPWNLFLHRETVLYKETVLYREIILLTDLQ